MLAEIFFLRLETMLRASEEADRAKKNRFVPLSTSKRALANGTALAALTAESVYRRNVS